MLEGCWKCCNGKQVPKHVYLHGSRPVAAGSPSFENRASPMAANAKTASSSKSRRAAPAESPAQRARRFDLLDHPMFFLAHIITRFDGNVVVDLKRHGFTQSDWRIISTL